MTFVSWERGEEFWQKVRLVEGSPGCRQHYGVSVFAVYLLNKRYFIRANYD